MIKLIIYTFFFISLFSCQEKKMEFIQSNVRPSLYLIKNPAESDSILKDSIKNFIIKKNNFISKKSTTYFYKHTSNTKYFINNDDDNDRFAPNRLNDYSENKIASYSVSKCINDTTKLIGQFFYYGYDRTKKINRDTDTLIYHCN